LCRYAARFSAAVESGVATALVWAQHVKAAADGPKKKKKAAKAAAGGDDAMTDDGDDKSDDEEELPTMTGTEEALSGAMGTKRLSKVVSRVAAAATALAEVGLCTS
jgi:hypothetical protein